MSARTDKEQLEKAFILPDLVAGKELRLSLLRNTTSESSSRSRCTERVTLTCTIANVFRPFTISPVLLVSGPVDGPSSSESLHDVDVDAVSGLPSSAILKLYDRRCFSNKREEVDRGNPWSVDDKERAYREYLADVASRDEPPLDFRGDPAAVAQALATEGEFEAYLRARGVRRGTDDIRTIAPRLGDEDPEAVCGRRIRDRHPRRVRRDRDGPRAPARVRPVGDPPRARRDLDGTTPPPPAERSARGGVRPGDGAGRPHSEQEDPGPTAAGVAEDAVVRIDFGHCWLRGEGEGEDEGEGEGEWAAAKRAQDEEGAAGSVLLKLVGECVGGEVWRRVWRDRWDRDSEEL